MRHSPGDSVDEGEELDDHTEQRVWDVGGLHYDAREEHCHHATGLIPGPGITPDDRSR